MDLANKPTASQGISRSAGSLISQAWSPNPPQMAPWRTDQTSHGCSRQLLSPAAALLVVSPHIPRTARPRVLQRWRHKDRTSEWLQIRSWARLCWRTLFASVTHMHAPDKPAFLSGSARAAPFLSLPFCPGRRMMGCQKGIWGFQIR